MGTSWRGKSTCIIARKVCLCCPNHLLLLRLRQRLRMLVLVIVIDCPGGDRIDLQVATAAIATVSALGASTDPDRWMQQPIRIRSKPRRHPETMHLRVYSLRYLLVVILFKLFKDGLTLKLADVRTRPAYLVTNDAHKAQVVVSLARLTTLLIGTFGRMAQFTLLIALVVMIGYFLLDRLIDISVVFRVHGRAIVHGLQPVDQFAEVEAQVAPLERELRGVGRAIREVVILDFFLIFVDGLVCHRLRTTDSPLVPP